MLGCVATGRLAAVTREESPIKKRLLAICAGLGSLLDARSFDVVVVDAENTRLTPAYHPVGTLVRYAVGTDVESVVVAGRTVVDEGRVLTDTQAMLVCPRGTTIIAASSGPIAYPTCPPIWKIPWAKPC